MESLFGAASSDVTQCRSADDMKAWMVRLFAGKLSPTRAEHVSASFDIPSDVVLNLGAATHSGGEPTETAAGGDAVANLVGGTGLNAAVKSLVTVRDVVMNQPTDRPILQQAVATFIVMSMRETDGSAWVARSASRSGHGWTLTCACKGSMECWLRAHPRRSTVGQSSWDDMRDLINLSRPAFDCRGVITITFSRFSRSVVVKYEHTNFHTTVAQLSDLFPPPRPPSPIAQSSGAPGSTKKRPKPAGEPGTEGTPRTKKARQIVSTGPEQAGPKQAGPRQAGPQQTASEQTAEAPPSEAPPSEAPPSEAPPPEAPPPEAQPAGDAGAPRNWVVLTGPKAKKPRKPRKRNPKSVAAGAADTNEMANAAVVATEAVDTTTTTQGADTSHAVEISDGDVAHALQQYLNTAPADGPDDSTSGQRPDGNDYAAAAAAAAAAVSSVGVAQFEDAASRPSEASPSQPAASTAAGQLTSGSEEPAAAEKPPQQPESPYMLVTEAQVSSQRRLTAIKLLTERNVDPATLNHEQFCTFANQAPSLQRESLELLAHYGAERLAIVPPRSRSAATTQPTSAPLPVGVGAPAGTQAVTASQEAPAQAQAQVQEVQAVQMPIQTQTRPQTPAQPQELGSGGQTTTADVASHPEKANSAKKRSYVRRSQPTEAVMEAGASASAQIGNEQAGTPRKPVRRRSRKNGQQDEPLDADQTAANASAKPPRKPRARKSAAAVATTDATAALAAPADEGGPNTSSQVPQQLDSYPPTGAAASTGSGDDGGGHVQYSSSYAQYSSYGGTTDKAASQSSQTTSSQPAYGSYENEQGRRTADSYPQYGAHVASQTSVGQVAAPTTTTAKSITTFAGRAYAQPHAYHAAAARNVGGTDGTSDAWPPAATSAVVGQAYASGRHAIPIEQPAYKRPQPQSQPQTQPQTQPQATPLHDSYAQAIQRRQQQQQEQQQKQRQQWQQQQLWQQQQQWQQKQTAEYPKQASAAQPQQQRRQLPDQMRWPPTDHVSWQKYGDNSSRHGSTGSASVSRAAATTSTQSQSQSQSQPQAQSQAHSQSQFQSGSQPQNQNQNYNRMSGSFGGGRTGYGSGHNEEYYEMLRRSQGS